MEKVIYNVEGLCNQTMKTQVCNAISNVNGVKHVGIALELGQVEVQFEAPATKEGIVNKIQQTGHKVTGSC